MDTDEKDEEGPPPLEGKEPVRVQKDIVPGPHPDEETDGRLV